MQVLLADIGGTHSRFGFIGTNGRPESVVSWDNDRFARLEDAIAAYLADHPGKLQAAVIGVAAPVRSRAIRLTNRSGWDFNLDELGRRFGLARVEAMNDFEAQAWSLGVLNSEDVRFLGPAKPAAAGAKVVLGPGTGLGVAALVPVANGWQAVSSEGGHMRFGAAEKDEEEIFVRLLQQGPVSAERVISGSGMPRLHAAVNPDAKERTAAEVVQQAQAGNAAACATITFFVRMLGRFAGDVALMFKAWGGVYITGGVTARLGTLLDEKVLRDAFDAHPPYEDILRSIPTLTITAAHPGLIGCAAFAKARLF